MSEIEFRDPPAQKRGVNSALWEDRLAPLLDHPNRWACVMTGVSYPSVNVAAVNLRKRRYSFAPGRWEFTTRKDGDNGELFARYLGPDEEPTQIKAVG